MLISDSHYLAGILSSVNQNHLVLNLHKAEVPAVSSLVLLTNLWRCDLGDF